MKRIERLKKELTFPNYYDAESFERDAKRYIKAVKEGRIIATIPAVYNKGMARDIKLVEMQKSSNGRYMCLNFNCFLCSLGYKESKKSWDAIYIKGTGMDMLFNTNHCIIQDLKRLGFITKKTAAKLAQKTPTLI